MLEVRMGKLALAAILLLSAQSARADYSTICGEGREKGAELAEVALIDTFGAETKLFINGKAIPSSEFAVKPLEGHITLVNVDQVPGKTQRFVFSHSDSTVQESALDEKDREKKVGKRKKCDWTEKDPPADQVPAAEGS